MGLKYIWWGLKPKVMLFREDLQRLMVLDEVINESFLERISGFIRRDICILSDKNAKN